MTKTLGLNFHLITFNRQNWRKLTVNLKVKVGAETFIW